MSCRDPQIEFKGYLAETQERELVASLIESLERMAPSDSQIKAMIGRANHLFEGMVSINSMARKFIVYHRAETKAGLIEFLQAEMTRQIGEWKRTRFSDCQVA